MFFTRAEKDAFKAGVRKGEKIAAISQSIEKDALANLWAALGASNQTEAIDKAEFQRETNLQLCVSYDKLKKERDDLEQCLKMADVEADRLRAQIRDLNSQKTALLKAVEDERAGFNRASDRNSEVMTENRYLKKAIQDLRGQLDNSIAADEDMGRRVNKVTGYRYPGVVVAKFETTGGALRYVVEATGEDYAGMLHIFNQDQLEFETMERDINFGGKMSDMLKQSANAFEEFDWLPMSSAPRNGRTIELRLEHPSGITEEWRKAFNSGKFWFALTGGDVIKIPHQEYISGWRECNPNDRRKPADWKARTE